MENARIDQWLPSRNLILLKSYQSKDNRDWTESWIIDNQGNVIKKIAEGKSSYVTFSSDGGSYLYTFEGNIWFDYLVDP